MVWWENIPNTCWFVFVEWKIGLSTREVRSAMSFALLHFVRHDLMNTNCVLWCQWTALPTTTIVWMCGGNWFECYVRSFVAARWLLVLNIRKNNVVDIDIDINIVIDGVMTWFCWPNQPTAINRSVYVIGMCPTTQSHHYVLIL